jgi:hypothetical protein
MLTDGEIKRELETATGEAAEMLTAEKNARRALRAAMFSPEGKPMLAYILLTRAIRYGG